MGRFAVKKPKGRLAMRLGGVREFIQLESFAGILLFFTAVIAIVLSNTSLASSYHSFFNLPVSFTFGAFTLAKPLLLWVNDGLMAVFFLLVGCEIKREVIEGELSSLSRVSLPGIAAIGGMVVPALFYVMFNHGDPTALKGWAIPTATDIAFALGILSLLGKRVPLSLKVFLTALAIFDDVGAVLIIAIYYTAHISVTMLVFAGLCIALMALMHFFKVVKIFPYILVGIVLWFCVLKSGVHATLAGVVLAIMLPMKGNASNKNQSPLKRVEKAIHPWVAYMVLPLFAFANAGVELSSMTAAEVFSGIPTGIVMGLFLGKQLGVFFSTWLAIKLRACKMPADASWLGIYGVSILCGVGFTMSLFVGSLAFEGLHHDFAELSRMGILTGSFLSGILGYLVLSFSDKRKKKGV